MRKAGWDHLGDVLEGGKAVRTLLALLALGFAVMWLHDGLGGMYWRERAQRAEKRAAEAEEWAEVVAAEAQEWLERAGR